MASCREQYGPHRTYGYFFIVSMEFEQPCDNETENRFHSVRAAGLHPDRAKRYSRSQFNRRREKPRCSRSWGNTERRNGKARKDNGRVFPFRPEDNEGQGTSERQQQTSDKAACESHCFVNLKKCAPVALRLSMHPRQRWKKDSTDGTKKLFHRTHE